ncbi:MAG: dihydrofolate reductase [Candidatus Levybacteria bacterium]|nr:dihydrofolate reductase [Candidatus Levybacteria bacterium]
MELILVMVTSLDGRTTRGTESDNHTWTSPEDQKHFMDIIENAKLIIMGNRTYEPAKENMKHREGRLRVIITRTPEKYDNEKISGQLEFTNESPTDLIKRLESQGFNEGYLVGGANTNTEFFKQKLVTEFWQTLEPKILGTGNGIVGDASAGSAQDEEINVSLELKTCEKLNDKGTLLLKYKVLQ